MVSSIVLIYSGSLVEFHGLPVVSQRDCPCGGCLTRRTGTDHAIRVDDLRLTVTLWDANGELVPLLHVRPSSLTNDDRVRI